MGAATAQRQAQYLTATSRHRPTRGAYLQRTKHSTVQARNCTSLKATKLACKVDGFLKWAHGRKSGGLPPFCAFVCASFWCADNSILACAFLAAADIMDCTAIVSLRTTKLTTHQDNGIGGSDAINLVRMESSICTPVDAMLARICITSTSAHRG